MMASRKTKYGCFITFEGGEGSGKSTQITLLAAYLRDLGHEVIVTREPGGTKGAEMVRQILLAGKLEKYGPFIETLLIAAARADHVDQLIAPAINTGKIVLCDRFIDSTRVYQGDKEHTKADVPIAAFERLAILDMRPHLTFLLDLPASIGLARANERRGIGQQQDRFEKEAQAVHERRRHAFLRLAKQEPQRFIVLDALRPPEIIAHDIAAITIKRLRHAKS